MRQNYSTAQLQEITDLYPNLGYITNSHLFMSGFENSNYFVETDKGKFVVKVFEGIGIQLENILFELEVMDACYRVGVKTPHILKNKLQKFDTVWNEKFVIVMDFIDGENKSRKQISDEIAYAVGHETGKMDTALSYFQDGSKTRQNYEWDMKNFLMLEPKIKYLDGTFDTKLVQNIFDTFKKIKPTFDTLPKGIIHNDVALHNILVKDSDLTAIIDFSDIAFSPYIQNLAVPMAQLIFCYNWKPNQAKLLIKGYKEAHPLSQQELDLLYHLTCARYALLVVEFNYWDKELFGEDKQRSDTVRDFYGFMLKFMELGRENFNQLITI